jgi:hypothetical protein
MDTVAGPWHKGGYEMAIKQVKLPDGRIIIIDEWLQWPIYSTIEIARNATIDLRAFSYVVGDRVPQTAPAPTGAAVANRNSSQSDTNQVAKSRMNHDEAFVAFGLTYEHFALLNATVYANAPADVPATRPILTGTDLRKLQMDCMLEVVVGAGINKPQISAPFAYYGQSIGSPAYASGDAVDVAVAGSISMNFNYGTAGAVQPSNQRRWQLPVYIHSDRVFSAKMTSPIGPPGTSAGRVLDQDVQLKFYLDGIKRRPVA